MPTPPSPLTPTPAGGDHNAVPANPTDSGPGFEERLQLFWEKNNKAIGLLVLVVLLVIVAKGGWEYLAEKKESDIRQAYAASTDATQLKAFAAAHPEHPLAGAAQLRIADEIYAAGRFAEAIAPYEQAASVLKTGALATRARLGAAMAKHQAGRTAEAETALKAIAADTNETKAYRAEALAHLAGLASTKGNAADLKSYADQLMQLDPASPWTQRTLQLLAGSPAGSAPDAPAPAGPAITLPSAGK